MFGEIVDKLLAALSIPFLLLNTFGGIVSGIWLLIIGDWQMVVLGIALLIPSSFLLGLALIPSLALAGPTVHYSEKGRQLGCLLFGALYNLYCLGLISVWCLGILFIFLKKSTDTNFIPILLWAYGVAMGPWVYMLRKDEKIGGGGAGGLLSIFLAELGLITIIIFLAIQPMPFSDVIKIFAGFMLLAFILQMILLGLITHSNQRSNLMPETPDWVDRYLDGD